MPEGVEQEEDAWAHELGGSNMRSAPPLTPTATPPAALIATASPRELDKRCWLARAAEAALGALVCCSGRNLGGDWEEFGRNLVP